jgi:flagellar hook-length control protein FliK
LEEFPELIMLEAAPVTMKPRSDRANPVSPIQEKSEDRQAEREKSGFQGVYSDEPSGKDVVGNTAEKAVEEQEGSLEKAAETRAESGGEELQIQVLGSAKEDPNEAVATGNSDAVNDGSEMAHQVETSKPTRKNTSSSETLFEQRMLKSADMVSVRMPKDTMALPGSSSVASNARLPLESERLSATMAIETVNQKAETRERFPRDAEGVAAPTQAGARPAVSGAPFDPTVIPKPTKMAANIAGVDEKTVGMTALERTVKTVDQKAPAGSYLIAAMIGSPAKPVSPMNLSGVTEGLPKEVTLDGDLRPLIGSENAGPTVWDAKLTTPASLAQVIARAETPTMIARQIAEAIQRMPDKPVELSLNPRELGRVKLSISVNELGIAVSVVAERPETLDLMRRNIDQLGREFQNIGYDNISFAFSEGQPDRAFENASSEPENPPDLSDMTESSEISTSAASPLRISLGGLDLRL